MTAPEKTTARFVPYKPGAGGDLVIPNVNAPEDVIRLWVAGDAFPRIVLDIPNHAVNVGDGTVAPTPLSTGGGGGSPVTQTTVAGTTDTLALADNGVVKRYTNAAAVSATVPTNAAVAFAVGSIIGIYAAGAAGVAIVAAGGVTIRNNISALIQYQEVSLRKDGTDEWVRLG